MSVFLIITIALGLAGLSAFFTLQESRLARSEAEPLPAAPTPGPTEDTPPATRSAAALPVPSGVILPTRARCCCGDPLAAHDGGPCLECACDRFAYAGGLVPKAG